MDNPSNLKVSNVKITKEQDSQLINPNDKMEISNLIIGGINSFYFDYSNLDFKNDVEYSLILNHFNVQSGFRKINFDDNNKISSKELLYKSYYGVFASYVTESEPNNVVQSLSDALSLLEDGDNNCGLGYDRITPFFQFRNHFLAPVLLSCGIVAYYIFENDKILKHWNEVLNLNTYQNPIRIAINSPLECNNILGSILYCRKAELIDNDGKIIKY